MDGLTHSLVGLASAKAGLERLSPYTAACCILSANAPDIDVVSFFFGGRWTLLQHHRGITHSVVGTLVLGALIPTILFGIERATTGRWVILSPSGNSNAACAGVVTNGIAAAITTALQ